MSTRPLRLLPYLLAFALGLGAAGLTACGGGSSKALIPAANADALKADLANVGDAVDAQDCTKVSSALAQGQRDLDQLPAGTSKRLQRKLQEGITRLSRQAGRECRAATTATATTQTVTTQTVTATSIPTTTIPTTTTSTTPTTTTPTTTTPTTTSPDNTGGVTTP